MEVEVEMEKLVWVDDEATAVLSNLDSESIGVYQFLSARFKTYDPAQDELFQFVFRSFYRMDNAGLTTDFKKRFFELMSSARLEGKADVGAIVTELRDYPTLKEKSSLQFSFATKLAATISPNLPIYDSKVASIFGFRAPHHNKIFEARLDANLGFYSKLQTIYGRIIEDDSLRLVRTHFRSKFGCAESEVSEHKALDFILWAAGKHKQRKSKKSQQYTGTPPT